MAVTKIESRETPRVKYAKKVRDGSIPEQIFIEGLRLAEEAVRSHLEISTCLCSPSFNVSERRRDLLAAVSRHCDEILELPDRLFSSVSDTKNAQGIVLICARPEADAPSFVKKFKHREQALPLVVMLAEVNNPANLGAVIRTAEAAGAAGVIVSRNSADPLSAKALRSAMGSAFRLPIWDNADEVEVMEWAQRNGLTVVAATGSGEVDYTAVDWNHPSLVVFGSEAHGLDPKIVERSTTVRIPMNDEVESLNLAVSAGVILFEARRRNSESEL